MSGGSDQHEPIEALIEPTKLKKDLATFFHICTMASKKKGARCERGRETKSWPPTVLIDTP